MYTGWTTCCGAGAGGGVGVPAYPMRGRGAGAGAGAGALFGLAAVAAVACAPELPASATTAAPMIIAFRISDLFSRAQGFAESPASPLPRMTLVVPWT